MKISNIVCERSANVINLYQWDLKGKTNKASLAFNKWEWPKNLENGEVDQMNDSDFVSISDSELNQGDPIRIA